MPRPKPSPAATMRVIEIIPQAMPNMVKSVRRLCAQRDAIVSRKRSRKVIPPPLLENDLLLFSQSRKNLRFHAVGDAQLDGHFLPAIIGLGVRQFDRGAAIFVIDERSFGHHKDVLLFFEK